MAPQRKSLLGYYLVLEGGIASCLKLVIIPNSNANTLHLQSNELIKLPNDMSDNRPKQSLVRDLWIDRFVDKSDDTTSRLSCSLGSNSTYHNDSLC